MQRHAISLQLFFLTVSYSQQVKFIVRGDSIMIVIVVIHHFDRHRKHVIVKLHHFHVVVEHLIQVTP